VKKHNIDIISYLRAFPKRGHHGKRRRKAEEEAGERREEEGGKNLA